MRNSRHRVNECWMKNIIKPLEFIFSIKMAKMTDGRYGYVCNLSFQFICNLFFQVVQFELCIERYFTKCFVENY